MKKKEWTKEEVEDKIKTDRDWLERGVLAIYKMQTSDEQQASQTRHHNKRGFSGAHASFLSYVAKWLLSAPHHHIDDRFIWKTRKYMVHYVGQLTKIANGEI